MPFCAVRGCGNSSHQSLPGVKYYTFPSDETLRMRWVQACDKGRKFSIDHATICSVHFRPHLKVALPSWTVRNPRKKGQDLLPEAVPTLFLPKPRPVNSGNKTKATVPQKPIENSQTKDTATRKPIEDSLSKYIKLPNTSHMADSALHDHSYTADNTPKDDAVPTQNNKSVSDPESLVEEAVVICYNIPENDQGVQALLEQNEVLKAENLRLKAENELLSVQKAELRVNLAKEFVRCRDILRRYFSDGVVRRMMSDDINKVIHWSPDDIAHAIGLCAVSEKSYNYLRAVLNIPLPGVATLKTWVNKFDFSPGLLNAIISLMERKGKSMRDQEKLCTIVFDEMPINKEIVFDKVSQQVIGPHCKGLVLIARGLLSDWKHVVYYNFDTNITSSLLHLIYGVLTNINYKVVGFVSNLGGENSKLKSDLGVSPESPYFHPLNVNDRKVYFFYDVPQLLVHFRNYFIDKGFYLDNVTVSKNCLLDVINIEKDPKFKSSPKLDKDLLSAQKLKRHLVGRALRLFSHTNAAKVEYHGKEGRLDPETWVKVADLFGLTNSWFDLLNSSHQSNAYSGTGEQKELLAKMNETIQLLRKVPTADIPTSDVLPFQEGIIITNNALQQLFEELKESFGIEHIVTQRLNHDVIKTYLSSIRAMGDANDFPDPLSFKRRLKWSILGEPSSSIFYGTNFNMEAIRQNDNSAASSLGAELPNTSVNSINLSEGIVVTVIDGNPVVEQMSEDLANRQSCSNDDVEGLETNKKAKVRKRNRSKSHPKEVQSSSGSAKSKKAQKTSSTKRKSKKGPRIKFLPKHLKGIQQT